MLNVYATETHKDSGKRSRRQTGCQKKISADIAKKISAGASRVTPPDPPTRHGVYLLSRAK
ncbi:hypothetical protein ASJ83_03460 [Methanocorpusculum parvum]|uniref:Uncharacterized protein n=1 Tax=Methanocorpusculum parvum TaxID=2193 RepID=A0AAX0Q5Z5_9EURY|nr:hypothetical protein ASJ83_03460 [Methanocorpusculum parvum]